MIGKKTKDEAVLLTLVERKSRFAIARKLDYKSAELVNQEVKKIVANHPELSFKTITADNGSKFSQLGKLTCVGETYYAHPYAFLERGTNEKLIRRWLPKGTKKMTPKEVAFIEN